MLDESGLVIPDAPRKPLHFTAQAKRSHVNAFESSAQTMSDYCNQHNIPLSTFSGWVTKYGKKQQAAFVPLQVESKHSQKAMQNQPTIHSALSAKHIEIHRGDLKVIIPVMPDVTIAVEIIKGVLACN